MTLDRIAIISQARLKSTRLPGKIFFEVCGRKLLDYHLERLSWSQFPVIVATTTNPADDPLGDWLDRRHVPFSRGSEEDVLARYYFTAKNHGHHHIVRVTSDCPLIDGHLIRKGMEQYLSYPEGNHYLSAGLDRSLPRGFDFEIFSFSMLERAFHEATKPFEREHVTPFFYINPPKDIQLHSFHSPCDDGRNHRLTVDTHEDFDLISLLIERHQAGVLRCEKIIEILNDHPEYGQINQHVKQKPLGNESC